MEWNDMMMRDGWLPWNGGNMPVSGEVIIHICSRDRIIWEDTMACNEFWRHNGGPTDIVFYRIAS